MWKLGFFALLILACNSGPPGATCKNKADGVLNGMIAQGNLGGGCDEGLTGAASGMPCKAATDCNQVCCACPGGGGANVSVQYCKLGVCATEEEACCTEDDHDSGPNGNSFCP
jgi:hypothetical protein